MFLGNGSPSFFQYWLRLVLLAGLSCSAREVSAQINARVMSSGEGGASFLPSRWGSLQVKFVNLDDKPTDLLAASFFEHDPSLQFGRKVWVPARSRMTLTHPVRIPALPQRSTKCNVRTVLIDPRQESETLVRSGAGDLQADIFLLMSDIPSMAMISVPEELSVSGSSSDLAYQLIVTARTSESLSRRMSQISDPILPATPEAYASLDQLIVADDRLNKDVPALSALRSWLYGGGHLWIMLDRIDPQGLELLLGDEWKVEMVDRIELTSFRMEPGNSTAGSQPELVQVFDNPVSMVRVVASDFDVAYSINGWPAAFWKQCGDGKLLVTTLSPEGWMRLGITAEEPGSASLSGPGRGRQESSGRGRPGGGTLEGGATAPADPAEPFANPVATNAQEAALLESAKARSYYALPPLKELSSEFFSPRKPPVIPSTVLEPHVREYVGNSVPPRWLISGMLAGFALLLAGLGAVLWLRGGLEWLGGAGPALAIGVSAVLMLMGIVQRRSIPPTVAVVQIIEPARGTNDIRVSGITDTYAPDAAKTILAASGGGWIMPDRTGQKGQTTRLVWTDIDVWKWEHLPPTSGQRLADFAVTASTEKRIQAQATFDSAGLSGNLDVGDFAHPADLLLATRDGRMGANLKEDGSFRATQVFSGEQYIAASLLSDEQNRRSGTMAALLSNSTRPDFPPEPKLLVWTDPLDLRFRFDEGHRQLGAALVVVPLTLERPAPGSEVRIPSPFLPYRAVVGPDGAAVTALYDYRRREWQDRTLPSAAWIAFQVPAVVLPLEPLRAKVTIQIAGPIGKLEISALRGSETVSVKTWLDPVGTLSFEVTDPTLLKVTEGKLMLKISGGDPSRPNLTKSVGKANYWRIESLHLELSGKTAAPISAVQP